MVELTKNARLRRIQMLVWESVDKGDFAYGQADAICKEVQKFKDVD